MEIYKKINYILTRRQKGRAVVLLFLIVVGAILELAGVAGIMPVINVASTPDSIENTSYLKALYEFLGMESRENFMVFLCASLIVIYLFKNLYLLFMRHMQNVFVYNNQYRLSCELTEYYVRQPYIYHANRNRSEVIQSISGDSSMFFQALSAVLQIVTEGVVCLALIVGLMVTDTALTIATAVIFVVFMLTFVKMTRKQIAIFGEKARGYNAKMTMKLYQLFGGIKDIKVLEREDYFEGSYFREYDGNTRYLKRYKFVVMLPGPVMESVLVGGLLGVLIVKIVNGANIQGLVPTLAAFAVAAFRILPSINRMTQGINQLTYNKVAVDKIYPAIKEARENGVPKCNVVQENGEGSLRFEQEIKVENITFSYPEREEKVLDKVSLSIPKNKSVAFVGPSGAGKTTLTDVILGVLEPLEGKILCDNTNIKGCMSAWHAKIGYIPQEVFLLDDTIRHNIAFGIPESEIDDIRVKEVLKEAQLFDFVESLSAGVNTSIGECGSRLSGGQKQRIGIARALYANPEILVMDEATSALDNDTESAVMEAVNQLAGKKTLIIIAHRLSTIEKCDTVYEIKNGKASLVR